MGSRSIKQVERDFIDRVELAHHLGCHPRTIERWIAAGLLPPPHYRFSDRHPVWLRRHYKAFVATGE
jgi:hypothetical protein